LKGKTLVVETDGIRLDKYISGHFREISRSHVQKSIKSGNVLVNKEIKPAKYMVKIGDIIVINSFEIEQIPEKIEPREIEFGVIHEDDHIIVVNKPPKLTVHPGAGNFDGTLVHGLVYHYQQLSDTNGKLRPGIVHRLDRDTSGVMIVAKTNQAHYLLAEQFENRSVRKKYVGITWGKWIKSTGTFDQSITRQKSDPTKYTVGEKGRNAKTDYQILEQLEHVAKVLFTPQTGRTHQIRVHSSAAKHPIFGDNKYGGGKSRCRGFKSEISKELTKLIIQIDRHALHSWRIFFQHPDTQQDMMFEAPIPADMLGVLEALRG
jgi:23S rRNA pseudouridine1911/1915/1917 synthase